MSFTPMETKQPKPRLVFFQFKYDLRLPEFLLIHKQEHVKCLSEFFEVIVIDDDCDYQHICDKYQPDLALFESGINHDTCHRLQIRNTHSHPKVPKIGFHHGDGFCNARAGFISDMDEWGINTFFTIATTAVEHTPEIADRLFVWPVFIDPAICRDFNLWKSIPVLLTGNNSPLYPWRRKINPLVTTQYPTLICPHPGYGPGEKSVQFMVGEEYARTINAACCVPACGTVAKEAVRKHFEVPGCKACLVTEESPALKAAGFVDMHNCVFADEHDVLDKLARLFSHRDELQAITDAGYNLVHSRHTLKQRSQIFDWFRLNAELAPDQTIIQLNPFDSPIAVSKASGARHQHLVSNGAHLELLREGDRKLSGGKIDEAERLYTSCLSYMRWMPEPKLRLALCSLLKGDARQALRLVEEPIHYLLCVYKSIDPEPVEWAYLIITFLCLGKRAEALRRANEFPNLQHPELERARWAAKILSHHACGAPGLHDEGTRYRPSIHRLPARTLEEWTQQLKRMLIACGQQAAAETLTREFESRRDWVPERPWNEGREKGEPGLRSGGQESNRRPPAGRQLFWFRRRVAVRNACVRLKRHAARSVQLLKRAVLRPL